MNYSSRKMDSAAFLQDFVKKNPFWDNFPKIHFNGCCKS